MKTSYQGNAKPYVVALFHEADQAMVTPILEALQARGLNLCYRQNRQRRPSEQLVISG